ncbi:hypothetical protein [Aestuariivivens sediminis]|uniref:hypothetical protein n=1 Tax=Aestuariivivens sediminis TaxID=2913557 RepID=UPI001F5A7CBD|nr:hypothetical protein [Aestuariivivens sediminis]
MKTILKLYKNQHNYSLDFPDEVEIVESCTKALKKAKSNISKLRKTDLFIAYQIESTSGDLLYKLPIYPVKRLVQI